MKVYVVTKLYFQGPEATCVGVYNSRAKAVTAVEAEETWNPEFRAVEEEYWGNEEASVTIEEHEVE